MSMWGMNIQQACGGWVKRTAWLKSKDRVMDPQRLLRNKGLNVIETSCDENQTGTEGVKNDDKMELVCYEGNMDYLNFEPARIGQVRSPY